MAELPPIVSLFETIKAEVLAVPVTARFVVVAFVPVALTKVKFWRVVEPVTRRLGEVMRPAELIVVVAVPPA